MKAVLISIQPKWCELIASGKKTIEVRKTRPKIETPFKCYIYCTNKFLDNKKYLYINEPKVRKNKGCVIDWKQKKEFLTINRNTHIEFNCFLANSKVIGEFICDKVDEFHEWQLSPRGKFAEYEQKDLDRFLNESCIPFEDVYEYRENLPYYKPLYTWRISDLKIYDEPKRLGEFLTPSGTGGLWGNHYLSRPPQSWCYAEELK